MSNEYRDRVALWLHDNAGNLLVQDDRDRGLGLKFPGGGIDPGQSVNEAAMREALEEVGYALADKPRAIPGVRAKKIDWDPVFSAEAAAKGRKFRGSKHYHRRALAGDRDLSLLGSEGDALKAKWLPIAEVLEATRSAAADPDNKYNYFDEERIRAAEKMYELLTQKTASDKLLRHRATLMLRDPETGKVMAGKAPADTKASPYFFPGGGLYDDEYTSPRSPTEEEILEGARREALEELGVELDNPRVVGGYGRELEDWWKAKTFKKRGVPYEGTQEHYVLADRGKSDDSMYNIEGDAFTMGDYYDPKEVHDALMKAVELTGDARIYTPYNREQARILKEYLMSKTSSDKNLENLKDKLRVAILSGSTGDDPEELSRSRALAEVYKDYLTSQGAEVDWMDMRNMDDMPDTYDWETDWYDDYKKRLTDADAMVVSTPIFNYGPSGRVLQFLHRTLDKENQQFKPYTLLSGAGSPRSALALGGLANQLDTEIKGIGIGGGVQVAGDEFDVETGEMDPGIISRANENAAKLLQVAGALRNKTSSYNSPYMQAYLAGVKLAEAQFDDYQNVSDPDGFDDVTTKANKEDPKAFRSTSYGDRSSPATNNYSTSGRNQSTHAKQPDEVTPDQTFATNSPKRDRLRGKYNG
tara:strand:- start:69272 stop:71200 length:1929 start_codon:yes stop_codon:yes gene_type:complete